MLSVPVGQTDLAVRLKRSGGIRYFYLCIAVLNFLLPGTLSRNLSRTAHTGCEFSESLSTVLEADVCRDVGPVYELLVASQLAPYIESKAEFNSTILEAGKNEMCAVIYIKDNELYVGGRGGRVNNYMLDSYLQFIHSLKHKSALPDMVLVVSGEDHPQAQEIPVFSFCRRPSSHNDLLLPNLVEDHVWNGVGEPRESRAGKDDPRDPSIVWYGRPHAWYRGVRKVVSEAGKAHPDRIHAGLVEWGTLPEWYKHNKETEWEGYRKEGLPQKEWAEVYKYQLNVQGNCASARLAYQLYSDAAVFIVSTDDQEWYTPLIRPYMHYIPVYAVEGNETKDSSDQNILSQVDWAESHPDLVETIVARSTEFAEMHLRPGRGRDCYTLMLLHAYSQLMAGEVVLPENAQHFTWSQPEGI